MCVFVVVDVQSVADDVIYFILFFLFFFFFKQKTAYEIVDCDWSSDVCSSDLLQPLLLPQGVVSVLNGERRQRRDGIIRKIPIEGR